MTEHSKLSSSAAERWLNCTPSAELALNYPQPQSPYAAEGSLAHEYGEYLLQLSAVDNSNEDDLYKQLVTECIMSSKPENITEEMETYALTYVDYCTEYSDLKNPNTFGIEEIVQIPEIFGWGTIDFWSYRDKTLHVIDLKYGKGKKVLPDHNPQLMLYAWGIYRIVNFMYEIKSINIHIYQPRVVNGINSVVYNPSHIIDWINEISPTAKKAYIGAGELKSGGWCWFCPVKQAGACPELNKKQLEKEKNHYEEDL